ncbi:MAG: glycosyltransferase family 1 protein [Chitinophagaceae bacterium]|nr:MAG: glycosyltransferase family 1 protein [Chitinophagaceae bacterium]
MSRLAIVSTHPIQYYAPIFQKLTQQNPDTKVFYTWGEGSIKKYDPDFKREIEWDIPLLEGYHYEFLENSSSRPGTSHFRGIVNPNAIEAIKQFNPDAILVYGWSWHSHLKIIRHFSGKKAVWFRGDSTCVDETKWYKEAVRKIILRWIYHHVDLAFYVGGENKKYFRRYGLKKDQLRFAPHAIDNGRFAGDYAEQVQKLRGELGIPSAGVLLLFAGKLEPKKDPLTLLRAFELLDTNGVYLLFVGNGVQETQLKRKAKESIKQPFIRFLDFQNQSIMPAIYQAAQLVCLPSAGPGETWGLAVNEAMAAGRAVVVSDKVGCGTDLVKYGINGAIFKHGDERDLAVTLQQLLQDKDQLTKFGQASRQIIENWSFDSQVSAILNELNQLS